MNHNSHETDPLIESLAEEAATLPGVAATEARRLHRRRVRRWRWTAVACVAVLGSLCFWQAARLVQNPGKKRDLASSTRQKSEPAVGPKPAGFARVQTADEARNDPWPVPPQADKDQSNLLEAARGLPLLLVMDGSGKIARIHVIER